MSNMIRLVYASRATFTPAPAQQGIEPTVARILMQSRKNNPRQQIGGVLYYGNGYFFQCLEGRSDAVNALTAKIMQDDRHADFQILKAYPAAVRMFSDWSMKYVPLDSDVRAFLKQQGMQEFDPYRLNETQIDALVELFMQASSTDSVPDQDYTDRQQEKVSVWRRLLRFFGLAK